MSNTYIKNLIEVTKRKGWITSHEIDVLDRLDCTPYLDTSASDLDEAWSKLNKYMTEFKAQAMIEDTWSSTFQSSFSNEIAPKRLYKNNYISIQILSLRNNGSNLILYRLYLVDKKNRCPRACNDYENMFFINLTDAIINFKFQVHKEMERIDHGSNKFHILLIAAHLLSLILALSDVSMTPIFFLVMFDLAYAVLFNTDLFGSSDIFNKIDSYVIDYIAKTNGLTTYNNSTTTNTSSDSVNFLTSVEDNKFWDISSLDKTLIDVADKITDSALLDHILRFYYKLESFTKYAQQNKEILNDYHINEIITRLEDICGLLEQYVELDAINKISKNKETKSTMALIKKAIKADIKLINQLIDIIFEQRLVTIKNKISVATAIVDEYNLYFKKK